MTKYENVDGILDVVKADSVEFANYEQRPNVNSKGIFGNVPLIIAITWGNIEAVELLLDAGADIDAICEEGNTPLHHAIEMGEFKIARILVLRGAKQDVRNIEGKRPCDLCWEGEWQAIFGVQRDTQFIQNSPP